ncbi:maternal effect embryo arrest 18 [Striga asiatica]|uniref:Maternal effect embryo arrest 18 n=1 Tax=Striga asiatica TaxID=4170 RepID=A0A5A7PH26_STRAF|nr:maternal effect embryo arrest 18 [Striga asiatica]
MHVQDLYMLSSTMLGYFPLEGRTIFGARRLKSPTTPDFSPRRRTITIEHGSNSSTVFPALLARTFDRPAYYLYPESCSQRLGLGLKIKYGLKLRGLKSFESPATHTAPARHSTYNSIPRSSYNLRE